MGYVLEAVLRAQMAKIRFADFKPAGTGYHKTPDMALVSYGVPVILKAVDYHSLENRYPDELNLRSTIEQMVEYMIDQHVPYGFHSIRRYHLVEHLRLLKDIIMRARRYRSSTAVNNGTTVKRSNFPIWMQTPGEKEAAGSKLENDNLAPINVALQWIRGPKVRRNQETEEAIDEAVSKGIEIPRTNQILP
ncbi:SNF2-like protein [Penicillium cf. viridicatum]|uniref:SNF2-like protein n=1 Tax=Penicillium cf. viridicatum TaxID=2972119 RepID=A0A9W9JHL3_9EURO|nr:SNF2-like protein [Penicillium cf. viridicatum]